MAYKKAFIPYGGYWSSPFCRWQGSFSHLHSMVFAAEICTQALTEKKLDPEIFDEIILGMTVPQKSSFYGAPWLAALMGSPGITGPVIGQACATSAKCVSLAAAELELGNNETVLVVTCDRTSNGPHIYYPNPMGIGGKGDAEDWVWDNFNRDPYAKIAMIQTAENVAREVGVTKEEQDEVAVMRSEQYQDALKDNNAFLKKFMVQPVEVKDSSGRKVIATVHGDEGVFRTTAEGLAKLRPALKDGTVSFGTQTYPADGNASLIVTSREKAQELSPEKNIEIQLCSYAEARTKKGFMALSIVPAARKALSIAGIDVKDVAAIKTHTPFAVNDVYFCKEMGTRPQDMNNYGCSLVWGHPQGPTGTRLIIELIEELVLLGGGYGLFDGCAAGDTSAAVVLKVDVK
ncbi:thiolase family protein [candidate division CSSED10-310 bacterium]|uniref:Thiolase family protein n=1 Tax=candidate division CSSED10-310 bacterium TaxID=2855610 RepID=A0ABV6Z2T5_UNCC1